MAAVRTLGARWASNEGAHVLESAWPAHGEPWPAGGFVLTLDRAPVAQTDPHGAWIEWL